MAFAKMSLAGLGGVLVLARGIVEQHRWMTPEEFKGPPVVILIILSMLYARDGEIDALRRTLAGSHASRWGCRLRSSRA